MPCPELTRREYLRLLNTARMLKRERTYFSDQDDLLRRACVFSSFPGDSGSGRSGKHRHTGTVRKSGSTYPPVLREELLAYAGRRGIRSGPVFITRNGSPVNRSNVSDSIRRLCRDAQVPEEKGNPRCLLEAASGDLPEYSEQCGGADRTGLRQNARGRAAERGLEEEG